MTGANGTVVRDGAYHAARLVAGILYGVPCILVLQALMLPFAVAGAFTPGASGLFGFFLLFLPAILFGLIGMARGTWTLMAVALLTVAGEILFVMSKKMW